MLGSMLLGGGPLGGSDFDIEASGIGGVATITAEQLGGVPFNGPAPYQPGAPAPLGVYQYGNIVRLTVEFVDSLDFPTDPTSVQVAIIDPTGATTTATWPSGEITAETTGAFYFDLLLSVPATIDANRYWLRFAGSGALVAAAEATLAVLPSRFA